MQRSCSCALGHLPCHSLAFPGTYIKIPSAISIPWHLHWSLPQGKPVDAVPGRDGFCGFCRVKGENTLENKRRVKKLIFAHDAPSGKLAGLQKRPGWARFERTLDAELIHLREDQLDEVRSRFPGDLELPAILAEVEEVEELVPVLGPDVIERMDGTPEDLKGRLSYHTSMKDLEVPYKEEDVPELAPKKRRSSRVALPWVR